MKTKNPKKLKRMADAKKRNMQKKRAMIERGNAELKVLLDSEYKNMQDKNINTFGS